MSIPRRRLLLLALLIAACLVGAGWALRWQHSSHTALVRAAEQLAECRRLIERIEAVREQPSRATERQMTMTDLGRLIEDAVEHADMVPAEQLLRISPQPARRLGDSAYQRKPTQILIRGASLEQVIRFLHRLRHAERELTVTALRLSAPRELDEAASDGPDRWTLEATLTYLIYAPRQQSVQSSGSDALVHSEP